MLKRCIVFCYCECIVFYCPEGDGHWMQAGALDSHSVVFWLLLSVSCVVVRFTSAFSFVVLKQTQAVHSPYALYNIKTVTSDTQSLCTLQYINSHKRYTVPMHSTVHKQSKSDTQSLCTLQYTNIHKRYTVPMHSTVYKHSQAIHSPYAIYSI